MHRDRVTIYVSDYQWTRDGREVTATESRFLNNKEWYTVGEGSTKWGYKTYEEDDRHFICYEELAEEHGAYHTYGVGCEAGYFREIAGYGVYIRLSGDLYTDFDIPYGGEEYVIPPENLIPDNKDCLRFLKDFFDSYTNKVFYQIEDVLAATKEPSDITILL